MGCLTAHCSCATNTSEREDLYPPIKDLVDALMAQRAEVFEVQNEGTDNVKGALREGKTTDDRDCYVRDLLLLYTLKMKWHTEFGHLNRGDMLTSEQHRCSNEKKKF
ncbi:NleF caspase inhibitor, partial [Escherichia albertii]|uniref:NleF caspase inhibitor n=1 Tax=Escherichia albertii TaxID=208962 RepID=UPI000ADF2D5E